MDGQSHSNACLWCRLHQCSSQSSQRSQVGFSSAIGIDFLSNRVYTKTILRDIEILPGAQRHLRLVPARFRKPIAKAIEVLRHQADVPAYHRHPMKGNYEDFWQVEVGSYRVFYWYDENTVHVRAIRLKGNKPTDEVFDPFEDES